ncbi:MAG TPA: hypothetical protein VN081_04890 [Dongiaceae bacterium]|nr:hypothetical protein [Dongiaceae bacterium]
MTDASATPAPASTEATSGTKTITPVGARRFYCFQYQVDELEYLGFFDDLKDCIAKTGVAQKGTPREHQWPLVETEVNRWILLVRSHPEATAFFALNYKTGKLEYFGDYPDQAAAVAARVAKGDPNEEQYEILDTAKLRTWRTYSSDEAKVPVTPFSFDHHQKNAQAAAEVASGA